MRKLFILLLGIVFYSCSENDRLIYSEGMHDIYYSDVTKDKDSIFVSLLTAERELTTTINVKLLGCLLYTSSLKFMYNSSLIRQAGKISVKVENKELKDVLSMVLGKVNLEYEFLNNVILIRQKGEGKSEQQKKKVVNGTVKDEHGVTLPGVSVLIKGESVGVATDINGKYSITIP